MERSRTAFTLLELLLVLAIVVAVFAIATPSIRRAFADQRLKKSAERVRVECTRTRVKAMKTGQIYAFRCVPDSGQFFVEPIGSYDDSASSATSAEDTPPAEQPTGQLTEPTSLADGVRFGSVDSVDGMALAEDAMSATAESLSASLPVFFYPDGTSSTAEVVLRNEKKAIAVQLRGLTGTARLTPLYAAEELVP